MNSCRSFRGQRIVNDYHLLTITIMNAIRKRLIYNFYSDTGPANASDKKSLDFAIFQTLAKNCGTFFKILIMNVVLLSIFQ